MKPKKFWMVFVEGNRVPRHKHPTPGEASTEAERLARKEGKPAYVLEAIQVCNPVPIRVVWQDLQGGATSTEQPGIYRFHAVTGTQKGKCPVCGKLMHGQEDCPLA